MGHLSCWNTHPWPIFSILAEVRRFSHKISLHLVPSIFPSTLCSCPVPLAEKLPFFSLQTWWVNVMPKNSILVSSDHSTFSQPSSESSRCLFANFRWAYTCAFLSRGTLRALHDFSPLWRVANGHLGDCGPSCLEIINKFLPCSFRSFPHFFHHQFYSTLGDLV